MKRKVAKITALVLLGFLFTGALLAWLINKEKFRNIAISGKIDTAYLKRVRPAFYGHLTNSALSYGIPNMKLPITNAYFGWENRFENEMFCWAYSCEQRINLTFSSLNKSEDLVDLSSYKYLTQEIEIAYALDTGGVLRDSLQLVVNSEIVDTFIVNDSTLYFTTYLNNLRSSYYADSQPQILMNTSNGRFKSLKAEVMVQRRHGIAYVFVSLPRFPPEKPRHRILEQLVLQ